MSCLFDENNTLREIGVACHGREQSLKACAVVLEGERWTGRNPTMMCKEVLGDEACDVGLFSDVNADAKQGTNPFEMGAEQITVSVPIIEEA
jgi:hypothetical protein